MQTTASPQVTAVASQPSAGRERVQRGIILFLIFVVCSALIIDLDRPPRPSGDQAPLFEFSAGRALKHLAVISRVPHAIHSPENAAVRDYIVRTLRELGLDPQIQQASVANRLGIRTAVENIVCRLKGSSQEKAVLFVAHYDSVPTGPGASDDGAAVAAFLESARALKTGPQLKRDIIFLFTDGEERGLLGATAFVAEHPWVHDAGVVLNFEARGIGGPSIMFETSNENGWLISNFGQAASHPVANSLSYEIYKRLPNNTDFTVFRKAGYSGLNFAYIDGLAYYHTSGDSIENIDAGSLQQHGDYVLEMARQFGNAASNDPRPANAVYFDVLGMFLVRYAQTTAIVVLVLTAVLLAFALYRGVRAGNLRVGASLLGVVAMIVGVALAVICAEGVSRIVYAIAGPGIRKGLMYHGGWYILAYSAIGLACAAALYVPVSKWIGSANLVAGILLGWLVVTIAVSVYFPGGAYLFLWPLLFSLIGWSTVFAKPQAQAKPGYILPALGALPALLLLVPMAHNIFSAFAAQSTMFVSVFAGLLLSLLIGSIGPETMPRRWMLPCLLGAAAVGLFAGAIVVSGS